ncbi:hypothetical protein B0T18DRAFT_19132 [Schizothecium vesticola]|uniref:Uncharacterized protein n=1 Tax=Schizothecium vesticola TaxID=314040 RepID=A0AA40F9C1_9PEZI|nr:hypothetical protein B0T18DRAFT_19132 [Schizothecium vesticola]
MIERTLPQPQGRSGEPRHYNKYRGRPKFLRPTHLFCVYRTRRSPCLPSCPACLNRRIEVSNSGGAPRRPLNSSEPGQAPPVDPLRCHPLTSSSLRVNGLYTAAENWRSLELPHTVCPSTSRFAPSHRGYVSGADRGQPTSESRDGLNGKCHQLTFPSLPGRHESHVPNWVPPKGGLRLAPSVAMDCHRTGCSSFQRRDLEDLIYPGSLARALFWSAGGLPIRF